MMKRIIISGAGGFLGSQIIERASLFDNPKILAITTKSEKFSDYHNVSCIQTDEFLQGKTLVNEDDVFINCLFPMHANAEQLEAGSLKSNQIIKAAKKSNVKFFINISSQRVYGPERNHPAKESDPVSPQTLYAKAKIQSEFLCDSVFADVPHANIRLSSLLGPDYSKQLVNRMILKALDEKYITVTGGCQRFSYLDVRDAADALLIMAMSDPECWKSIYNLGNNSSFSLTDISFTIKHILSEKGRYTTVVIYSGDDVSSSELDASLFMHDFSWTPVYSLDNSISAIVDNYLS